MKADRKPKILIIAACGLLVGTLDGAAAVIQYLLAGRTEPARVFLYIASGVFGHAAFSSGTSMVWWGVAFHYLIAFTWTLLYFVIYPRIAARLKSPILNGIVYGCLIWLVMNLIVLPLSAVRQPAFDLLRSVIGTAIIITCVGIPVSCTAFWFSRNKTVPPVSNELDSMTGNT